MPNSPEETKIIVEDFVKSQLDLLDLQKGYEHFLVFGEIKLFPKEEKK